MKRKVKVMFLQNSKDINNMNKLIDEGWQTTSIVPDMNSTTKSKYSGATNTYELKPKIMVTLERYTY